MDTHVTDLRHRVLSSSCDGQPGDKDKMMATGMEQYEDYNSNIECSLSKSLSTPRRCSYCQKIMFFKAYRCKHCRYRCHKKCAGHNHRKSHNCNKTYAGEEHWTKVLQANDVISNVVVVPCHGGRNRAVHPYNPDKLDLRTDRQKALLYQHNHHYIQEEQYILQQPEQIQPLMSPISGAKGPTIIVSDSGTSTPTKHVTKTDSNASKESNSIFSSLYARFCHWLASTRQAADPISGADRPAPKHNRSRSSSIHSNHSHDLIHLLTQSLPEDYHASNCLHNSLSSEDSESESLLRPGYSSTCSSITITSTSDTTSETHLPNSQIITNNTLSTSYFSNWISKAESKCNFFLGKHKRSRHSNLTFTISCPLRTKQASISQPERERTHLCATWPPTGRKRYNADGDDGFDDDGSVFGDFEDEKTRQKEEKLRESLGEFSIPYADLEFSDCIRIGRKRDIHRGRWHGEVMIHVYHDIPETDVSGFWEEVSKLSMIRHENVALFMGACVEPPHLAVITSVRKGISLYEQIHIKGEKMSLHSRVNMVRQIAQGMGYLHAKGVVMCKLNSRNIHLEPKVKLNLMDYSMSEKQYDRLCYGSVPRGHLTYAAPEILVGLKVKSPCLVSDTPYTSQTDVYAFGTVLFELMSGRFPFRGFPPEAIIWNIAKGRRQSLKDLKCNANLKSLMEQCWSAQADERPAFSHISKELQQSAALHKRHSSSEPERLNRAGLTKSALFA